MTRFLASLIRRIRSPAQVESHFGSYQIMADEHYKQILLNPMISSALKPVRTQ